MSITTTSRSDAYVRPVVTDPLPEFPVLARRSHGATASAAREGVFEQSILPHFDAAYNLAHWLTHDPVEAEGIVQEACLWAAQSSESIRGETGRTTLLRIVRNTAYARLRTKRTGIEVALDKTGDKNSGISANITAPSNAQNSTELNAAVAALPIGLRECIVLRDLEDLSYREISQITGAPIGTVMSRLYQARHLLMAA